MPGRKYQIGAASYRYSINGQEREADLNENITTALYWEYDSRIGRRWNNDPKPAIGLSAYSVFENNPVITADFLGDTTRYYTEKNELLLTTFAKGSNNIMIVSKDKVSEMKKWAKKGGQKMLDNYKDRSYLQKAVDGMFKNNGTTYDITSMEQFHDEYYQKGVGSITHFGGVPISSLSNIKVNGKSMTGAQFTKLVNSLGVGPEYIASLVPNANGMMHPGTDVGNDNDLVSVKHLSRPRHIHLHPMISAIRLVTADFVTATSGTLKLEWPLAYEVPPDNGDRSTNSGWNVLVRKDKVFLYLSNEYGNYYYENTITFDRKLRK